MKTASIQARNRRLFSYRPGYFLVCTAHGRLKTRLVRIGRPCAARTDTPRLNRGLEMRKSVALVIRSVFEIVQKKMGKEEYGRRVACLIDGNGRDMKGNREGRGKKGAR